MNNRLYSGDDFPSMRFNFVDGTTRAVPGKIQTKYLILIFYRAHWCPYCRRHLASLEKHKASLEQLGATILAGSSDDLQHALEVSREVSFPVFYGATRDDAALIGAWWGENRKNFQPAEFLIGSDGKVIHSLYASGPVGRMAPEDLVRQLTRMAETSR